MAELYPMLKHLHLTAVAISVVFFIARGLGMMMDAQWLQRKLVKIAPHVVDTILLLTAISLTFAINQYPFQESWLTAKVIGLIAYIGLGVVALKVGSTKPIRIAAFFAAITVVFYIIGVAFSHNPTPWAV